MSRVQIQILVGTLAILALSGVVIAWGLLEEARMAEYTTAFHARSIENGAELFSAQCSRCHGTDGKGITGFCPPLNDRNFFDNRLKEVGWSGSLEDYIAATASSGRLVSTRPQIYPGEGAPGVPAMPSFAQSFGGPLREDQIRDIAAFITNWESTATLVTVPTPIAGPVVGTDITKELPEGDAKNGEALTTALGCTACHMVSGGAGPFWPASAEQPAIGVRAGTRFTEAGYSGKAASAEQYLFESIVDPSINLISGFNDIMPKAYATQLTDQDMADLIAYLTSLK